jgi:hypothetical protein
MARGKSQEKEPFHDCWRLDRLKSDHNGRAANCVEQATSPTGTCLQVFRKRLYDLDLRFGPLVFMSDRCRGVDVLNCGGSTGWQMMI